MRERATKGEEIKDEVQDRAVDPVVCEGAVDLSPAARTKDCSGVESQDRDCFLRSAH